LRILQVIPDAVIHCFDPDPRALRAVRERLAGTSATIHPIAVSDRDGEAVFHQSGGTPPGRQRPLPGGWTKSGSLREPLTHRERWPWVTFDETINVPTRSLDSWAAEHGITHVDLIWMDVQGVEDLVIKGAPRLLEHTDWLYTEYSNDEWYVGQKTLAELAAMLPAWRVARRFHMDVLFERVLR
jgi:FkbM family methyltransferase